MAGNPNSNSFSEAETMLAASMLGTAPPDVQNLGLIEVPGTDHTLDLATFSVSVHKELDEQTVAVTITWNDPENSLSVGPVPMHPVDNKSLTWTPDPQLPASIAIACQELAGQVFLCLGAMEHRQDKPGWMIGALDFEHDSAVRRAWRHFLLMIEAGLQAIGDFLAWITGQSGNNGGK